MITHEVINALEEEIERRIETNNNTGGICDAIADSLPFPTSAVTYTKLQNLMVEIASDLGYYSGKPRFLIAHPTLTSIHAFVSSNLWSTETEYGRRRIAIAQKLIRKLREEADGNLL